MSSKSNPRNHARAAAITLLLPASLAAGAANDEAKPEFRAKPIGTLLIDGAVYASPNHEEFPAGTAIPEARAGATVSYGKWGAKVELGYSYNKLAIKDAFIEYNFNSENRIRIGSQVHQFGYQNSTAACQKVTMIEPMSNSVFNNGQMIGVQYYHMGRKFYATASAHAEPDATEMQTGITSLCQTGYGLRSRLAWHPLTENGRMFQIEFSGAFSSPTNNKATGEHDSFTMSSNFPTKVAKVTAIKATVDHAMNRWEFTPGLMASYGPLALEGQYFFAQVNRRENLQAYRAYGAYVTVRGLILGGDYTFSYANGGIANPRPRSLELLATYNYTCLSDHKAGIIGGRVSDVAAVANYYINSWMVARLRYGYTWVRDRAAEGPQDLGALQARIQIIF